jgi:hypothetical protein
MWCYFFLSRTPEKEEFQVRVSNTKHITRPILPRTVPPRHVRNYNSIVELCMRPDGRRETKLSLFFIAPREWFAF